MKGLGCREDASEMMDTEAVSFEEFRQCLRQLEFINRCTLAYRPTLAWLDRLFARLGSERPLNILDVGFGHGDMLRRIAAQAEGRGIAVQLAGVDLNPWCARAASLSTAPGLCIEYALGNVFELRDDRPADIIVSSLFAHHLSDTDLVRFLRWMDARARIGWFVNDLHRHPLPYHFIRAAVRLLSTNRLIRHDAPLSVARGFTKRDWWLSLDRSGIDPGRVTMEWFFPFRYCLASVR